MAAIKDQNAAVEGSFFFFVRIFQRQSSDEDGGEETAAAKLPKNLVLKDMKIVKGSIEDETSVLA